MNIRTLKRRLNAIGYDLVKLGRGDNYGYVIVDTNINAVVAGGGTVYGLTLDEVEDWLTGD